MYCKNNNIPFFCLSIDPKIYQNKTIKNFESWARKTRYDFFVTIANKTNIHDILIGHNLNDWLETAIMQENKKVKTFYYGIKQSNNINGLNIFRPFITSALILGYNPYNVIVPLISLSLVILKLSFVSLLLKNTWLIWEIFKFSISSLTFLVSFILVSTLINLSVISLFT